MIRTVTRTGKGTKPLTGQPLPTPSGFGACYGMHEILVRGFRLTIAPVILKDGLSWDCTFDVSDNTAAVRIGDTLSETIGNAFAVGLAAGQAGAAAKLRERGYL